MIKGINRQIIEVSDTGNPYFERALLVVRAGAEDDRNGRLHEEAQRFLRSADGYTGLRLSRRYRRRRLVFVGSGCSLLGAAVGMAAMFLWH